MKLARIAVNTRSGLFSFAHAVCISRYFEKNYGPVFLFNALKDPTTGNYSGVSILSVTEDQAARALQAPHHKIIKPAWDASITDRPTKEVPLRMSVRHLEQWDEAKGHEFSVFVERHNPGLMQKNRELNNPNKQDQNQVSKLTTPSKSQF